MGICVPASDTPGKKEPVAEWYFPEWLSSSPYSPSFEVRDTTNKYGRYATQTKIITLKDLIKFHGHFCGGLVESAGALSVAFDIIFPDKIIDRTDLRIVSNNSACGGDVAAYLTGSRLRFGTHHIDNNLKESEFFIQKVSTGETVLVKLNPNAYPTEVKTQMKKIESEEFYSPGSRPFPGPPVGLCPAADQSSPGRIFYRRETRPVSLPRPALSGLR